MSQKRLRKKPLWEGGEWFALIEIYRHGKMVLHDCKSLSDFSENRLGFVTKQGRILIDGSALPLISYHDGVAVVVGRIQRISFADEKIAGGVEC